MFSCLNKRLVQRPANALTSPVMLDQTKTPLSPIARYAADLQRPGIIRDPAQAAVVERLQSIYDELAATPPRFLKRRWTPVRGLYLWGGVGRGKTWLMDCFFDALPFTHKRRVHFHRFMQNVHIARKKYHKQRDPLRLIAREWASDRVLCFDEFFVSDIADAMILSRLTQTLFAEGVTLVATSNVAADNLYKDGLQRDRFLPAIQRIKQHCHVMHLTDGTDFRLDLMTGTRTYHIPAGSAANTSLDAQFERLAGGRASNENAIEILGRKISTRRQADNTVWFDFDVLCKGRRAAADYSEIARQFQTVMLSGIPLLSDSDNSATRRFINLIDELYDRRVKLFCSAEAEPDELYSGRRLQFEFERTVSRLHEMSSKNYLAEPHLS